MQQENTKYNLFQWYAKEKQEGNPRYENQHIQLSEEEKQEIKAILTFQLDYLECV